jgi:3'(2'), 5'-bisphosphate nucleotidase
VPGVTSDILDAARAAVAAACVVCRHVRAGAPAAITKADDSPVTIADFAAQAVVLHVLGERLGDLFVIAEEESGMLRRPGSEATLSRVVQAARVAWPDATADAVLHALDLGRGPADPGTPCWALDPIDGTKGFLRGGQFAVCLALIEGDEPTLGLLGCPHLPADLGKDLAVADPIGTLLVAGPQGATWEPLSGTAAARPLEGSPGDRERLVLARSLESGHSRVADIERVIATAQRSPTEILAVDSQVKYGLVARGRADVYLRIPHDRSRRDPVWDHAAGAVIARAAGMEVTDARGGALRWRSGPLLSDNFGILCAPPHLHEPLARAATAVLDESAGEKR